MHGVRHALLDRQIAALNLSAIKVAIPSPCPNEIYEARMADARTLLADLPRTADPCGENGEFHTVVSAGPMFATPIPVRIGKTVDREGFVFTDVLPQ